MYMYIPWVSAGTHQVMGSWFPLSMDVSKDRELLRRRNISKNFFFRVKNNEGIWT